MFLFWAWFFSGKPVGAKADRAIEQNDMFGCAEISALFLGAGALVFVLIVIYGMALSSTP